MFATYPLSGSAPQPSASATQYTTLDCTLDGSWIAAASFDQREMLVRTPMELRGLTVSVTTAPGVGNSRSFTVMRSTESGVALATGITLTISDTNTSASSTEVVSFGVGDTLYLRSTISGTPAAAGTTDWYTSYRAREQAVFSCNFTASSNSVDSYQTFMGAYAVTAEPTESDAQAPIPFATTISNLAIRTPAGAPGAGTSFQVILRKNGADTALTATISGTGTIAYDTSNTVNVAAGDLLCWRIIPTGTPTARSIVIGCKSDADTFGASAWMFSVQGNTSTSAARYVHPYGRGQGTFNATETSTDVKIEAGFQADALYVRQGTAPDNGGGTQSYAYKVRRNAADDGPAVTLSEANTTGTNGTNGTTTSAGDLLAVSITPSGTPAGSNGIGLGLAFTPVVTNEGFVDLCSAELGTASAPYYGGCHALAGTSSVTSSNPRTGTYAYLINPTTTATGSVKVGGYGFDTAAEARGHYLDEATYTAYLRIDTLPASASEEIAQFHNAAGSLMASLRVTSAGKLQVYNSTGTSQQGSDGATVLSTGTYYRIEFKLATGASAAYTLRIDGTSELSGTLNAGTGRNAYGYWGKVTNRNGQTVSYTFDDLSVRDNGFITTDYKVALCLPNAAGAVQSWNSSTDTPKDYTQINDIPPVSTSEIAVKAANQGFSVGLASAPAGTIQAVKQFGYFADAATDGETRVFLRLRTGGTDYDRGGYNFGLTETPLAKTYNTDGSGAAWSQSTFDSTEVGAWNQKTVADAVGCSWMGVLVAYEESQGSKTLLLLGVGS